jgi:DNA-binding transcriptional ArsR family regulator/rhodanese-related sulfurtransferase
MNMSRHGIKSRIYEEFARIARALASPQRLEIVELLSQSERSVESLARALSVPMANASHHLQALRAAGLVAVRKEGTFAYYRLDDPDVFEVSRMIRTLAERHLAEVDRIVRTYFDARDELEPIGQEELLERARASDVVVLDVRPAEEFRAGHIAGAMSVPVGELERRLSELPAGKEIIAYCRGPYCVMAFDAVRKLRAKGRAARRLVDGFPEWRAAGLPVESSEETPA